jgi:hypothetical protein
MENAGLYITLAALFGLFMAWGIGANDVANAMATSVGSRVLTIRQAILVAAVFEFLGAYLAGASVTSTIRSGIVDPELFADQAETLVFGMLAALLAAGSWLLLATFKGWPVSTTHTIVGGIVGLTVSYTLAWLMGVSEVTAGVGMARRALEMMAEHARQRVTWGVRLADRQAIQWFAAEAAMEMHACRLMVTDLANKLDAGADVRMEASILKVRATEMAQSVLDNAMQTLGAMGMTKELPLQLMHQQVLQRKNLLLLRLNQYLMPNLH